jgi:hypothetical protein
LPSPRLTFTGRFRAGKAPGVRVAARAPLAAPPAAYLVGDCPTRQAVIRLVAGAGPLRGGVSVHLVPSRQEAWS